MSSSIRCFDLTPAAFSLRFLLFFPSLLSLSRHDQIIGRRISPYKGVFSQPGSKQWIAIAIARDGKQQAYLGSHATEVRVHVYVRVV